MTMLIVEWPKELSKLATFFFAGDVRRDEAQNGQNWVGMQPIVSNPVISTLKCFAVPVPVLFISVDAHVDEYQKTTLFDDFEEITAFTEQ